MADLRTPPRGGGTGRRPRRRYADDKQVDRAVELAKKHGVALELGADGSVKILGKLDSVRAGGVGSKAEGNDDDVEEEIRRCREAITRNP